MLSYAFQTLKIKEFEKISNEEFENTSQLFSEILIIGINKQIKQGLIKNYIAETDTISTLKGKINLNESINPNNIINKQINCTFDEFSVNIQLNKILKSTIKILLKADIKLEQKKSLKKILLYFSNINTLNLSKVNWNIRYDRNNQNYQMLINICYLTFYGLIQNQNNGDFKVNKILDEQRMSRLYEKFILEYYKREHPYLKVHTPRINWQLDTDENTLLPQMQTDIVLETPEKILIIDAKYYKHTTKEQFNVHTLHSANLYQIFTYVKNMDLEVNENQEVSGMLLYAKTDEHIHPDYKYKMSGNYISVKTLDLNQEFANIKQDLNNIVEEYF